MPGWFGAGSSVATCRRVRVSKKRTWPAMLPDGERAPVGVDGGAQDGGAVRANDADRGRAAQQGAEQVAARPDRVVERHALAGEQQRAIELGVEQARGRRVAEPRPLSPRRARSRADRVRRRPRSRPATSSARDGGEDGAQPALRSARWRSGSAARNARSVGVELGVVVGRPFQRRGQPRAAVELAGVAAAGVPLACGVSELVVQAAALGVLLEPAAQARPLAQQRLVRDLDLARR